MGRTAAPPGGRGRDVNGTLPAGVTVNAHGEVSLPLNNLRRLAELDLRRHRTATLVRTVTQLPERTPYLQFVNLADQRVRSVAALGRLGGLRELCLAGNRLEDVSLLAGCLLLEKLNLDRNLLHRIPEELSALAKLHSLSVRDNRVVLLSAMAPLASLGRLADLKIAGNPAALLLDNAQHFLFGLVPSLRVLDGRAFSDEERHSAAVLEAKRRLQAMQEEMHWGEHRLANIDRELLTAAHAQRATLSSPPPMSRSPPPPDAWHPRHSRAGHDRAAAHMMPSPELRHSGHHVLSHTALRRDLSPSPSADALRAAQRTLTGYQHPAQHLADRWLGEKGSVLGTPQAGMERREIAAERRTAPRGWYLDVEGMCATPVHAATAVHLVPEHSARSARWAHASPEMPATRRVHPDVPPSQSMDRVSLVEGAIRKLPNPLEERGRGEGHRHGYGDGDGNGRGNGRGEGAGVFHGAASPSAVAPAAAAAAGSAERGFSGGAMEASPLGAASDADADADASLAGQRQRPLSGGWDGSDTRVWEGAESRGWDGTASRGRGVECSPMAALSEPGEPNLHPSHFARGALRGEDGDAGGRGGAGAGAGAGRGGSAGEECVWALARAFGKMKPPFPAAFDPSVAHLYSHEQVLRTITALAPLLSPDAWPPPPPSPAPPAAASPPVTRHAAGTLPGSASRPPLPSPPPSRPWHASTDQSAAGHADHLGGWGHSRNGSNGDVASPIAQPLFDESGRGDARGNAAGDGREEVSRELRRDMWLRRSADDLAREAVASPGTVDEEEEGEWEDEEEGCRDLQTRGGNTASEEWAQVCGEVDSKLGKYRSEVAHLDQKLALPQQVGINVVLRHSPERREVLQHSHSRARPVPPARRDLSPPSLFAIPPYASRSFSPAPRTSPGRGRSPAGSGYAMHSPGYALAHARPQGGFVAAALTQLSAEALTELASRRVHPPGGSPDSWFDPAVSPSPPPQGVARWAHSGLRLRAPRTATKGLPAASACFDSDSVHCPRQVVAPERHAWCPP